MLYNIYILMRKFRKKLATWIFVFKYFPILLNYRGFSVGRNVQLNYFGFNNSRLKIRFLKSSLINDNVIIQGSGYFQLGSRSFIGSFSVIGVNEKVVIGNNVMIAQGVSIRDTNHAFTRTDIPMIYR